MKKSLLATVAAVSLFAATGMAAAAEGGRDHGGSAGMSQGSAAGTSHGMSRGAEKSGAELKGNSETTGAATNMEGSKSSAESNELKHQNAPKAGSKASSDKAKSSTTGQGTSSPAAKSSDSERNAPASKSTTNDRSAPASKSATDEKAGAAGSKSSAQNGAAGAAGGSVSLNAEQKTKIRTTVLRSSNAPKVSRSSINFNIRVGTVVPRSVHFVTVPATLVEIHPAWRGYSYFIVDEEIIIVEPSSFKIVAVLTV
jgi:hypothetical protein